MASAQIQKRRMVVRTELQRPRRGHVGFVTSRSSSTRYCRSEPTNIVSASSGRADDRLALAIQRRVEHHRVAGQRLEPFEQRVVARIRFAIDDLDARGAIAMYHFGNPRFHCSATSNVIVMNGAGMIRLDDLRRNTVEHARTERPPAFTKLDLRVDAVGDAGRRSGQPRMLRAPSARGPNSIRPWNHATGWPSASSCAACAGTSSSRLQSNGSAQARTAVSTLFGGEARTQIGVAHARQHMLAARRGHVRCRAERSAGIARRGLHEQFFYVAARDEALIEFDVQRAAAGECQPAGLGENVAEVNV